MTKSHEESNNNFIKFGQGPYNFDKDVNGALALTPDNVVRSRFLLFNDSSYRFKPEDDTNSDQEITDVLDNELLNPFLDYIAPHDPLKRIINEQPSDKNPWENLQFLKKLVEKIDSSNSTRLESLGPNHKKPESKEKEKLKKYIGGRELTARYIASLEKPDNRLDNRLRKGDPKLVNEIAVALIEQSKKEGIKNVNKNSFSFASKFCTYVQLALLEKDELYSKDIDKRYSIYDKVIRKILPYYAAVYVDEEALEELGPDYTGLYVGNNIPPYTGQKEFDPFKVFGESPKSSENQDPSNKPESNFTYKQYSKIIELIIEENRKKTGYTITRRNLDTLLWYYYKGEPSRIKATLELIRQPKKKDAGKETSKLKESQDNFKNSERMNPELCKSTEWVRKEQQ